jgi:cytochrome c oxidase assembly protein subunit 15
MTAAIAPADPILRRRVGVWLAIWAVMVLLTVVIGGVTRLTESGLSITEWKPVSGVFPPLSQADWTDAFDKYRQIPEYRELNAGMSLEEFQGIYLIEYLHRLWARVVGLALAVPFLWFLLRGGLGQPLVIRLSAVLGLTLGQGVMGWWMVQSGLTLRTDVSHYRLAAHLALALVLFVMTVWTAADLLAGRPRRLSPGEGRLRRLALGLTGLVFVTAIAGAFVAGLDAGKAYNTFPLMGGRVVPAGYLQLRPWYLNPFDHVPAVQFNHRVLGVLTLVAGLWLGFRARGVRAGVRLIARLAGLTAALQAVLGVATLLLVVPIPLAALHQAGAVVLLGLLILTVNGLSPGSRPR